MLKSLLISFWFALLLLPFKGIRASVILCIILFALLLSLKQVHRLITVLFETVQPLYVSISSLCASKQILFFAVSLFFLGLIAVPFFAGNYLLDVAILTGIYTILAIGLNIVVGLTGLLNLGFVAFYALGAYTYALLNVRAGLDFWQALPLCIALTTMFGFILAIPALRLKGDYLAIVTLGLGEITRLVLNNWDSFTNGPNGISGITPPYLFGYSLGRLEWYYYLVLLSVVLTYGIVRRIRLSKVGRAWIAIREDEVTASTLGINTTLYKLFAMAFGSLWAGLAGALFAAKMQFISPESFTFMESVLILCMVILGGLGSLPGVVVGALILVMLPEVLREVQSYRMLALGTGLIVMMIFRPQGLLGGLRGEK